MKNIIDELYQKKPNRERKKQLRITRNYFAQALRDRKGEGNAENGTSGRFMKFYSGSLLFPGKMRKLINNRCAVFLLIYLEKAALTVILYTFMAVFGNRDGAAGGLIGLGMLLEKN